MSSVDDVRRHHPIRSVEGFAVIVRKETSNDERIWHRRASFFHSARAVGNVGSLCGMCLGMPVRCPELLLGRRGPHRSEPLETASVGPVWVAINLVDGILKAAAGLIPLELVRSWGRIIPHWMLLLATGVLGVGMYLYGGLGLVSNVLHVTGVINDPTNQKWFFWYLVLWDPW